MPRERAGIGTSDALMTVGLLPSGAETPAAPMVRIPIGPRYPESESSPQFTVVQPVLISGFLLR